MKTSLFKALTIFTVVLGFYACKQETAPAEKAESAKQEETKPAEAKKEAAATIKTDSGVDLEKKVIRIGTLNDESGPGAAVGKAYAAGKRILAAQVNAGGSGLLPEGWKVELVEKDHGYNPQKAVQSYEEIKEKVLFIGTSFGTPTTLPLRASLEKDNIIAFPASLSSKMAEHKHTPPSAAGYNFEAMRAMDFAVKEAGGAANVKAAIIYQGDDYGKDGLDGWKKAAEHHKVPVVSEQSIKPGQKDFAATVMALKKSGANVVLLAVLPSATGPVLGTAAKMKYMPFWMGNTPSWIDAFFIKEVIPPVVFSKYFLVTSAPYWGEKVGGMDKFLGAFKQFAGEAKPNSYILFSYLQGLAELEAAKKAIEAGDITREGYKKALTSMTGFTAGGLTQPVNFSKFPYEAGTKTRVLAPVMAKMTWEEVAPFATCEAASVADAAAPAEKAKDAKN